MDTTQTIQGPPLVDQKDSHIEENSPVDSSSLEQQSERPKTLKTRILTVLWDSFDKSPEERRFIAKIDWWILTYCCIAYFVKYLDQTNVRPDRSRERVSSCGSGSLLRMMLLS